MPPSMPPTGLRMRDDKAKHFKPLINAVLRRVAREGAACHRRAGCRAPQHAGLAVDALVRGLWRRDGARDRRRACAAAAARSRHESASPLPSRAPPPCPAACCGCARACASTRCPVTPKARGGCRISPRPCRRTCSAMCAGKRVIDLCAAPGGKTAQLIARGAQVTAVEREPERMARLKQNLARLKLDAELHRSGSARLHARRSARPSCCSTRPAAPPARSAAIPNCPGSRAPPM